MTVEGNSRFWHMSELLARVLPDEARRFLGNSDEEMNVEIGRKRKSYWEGRKVVGYTVSYAVRLGTEKVGKVSFRIKHGRPERISFDVTLDGINYHS